ncbi:MAG: hypothetical protein AAFX79_13065 [Planctomycetota bacterium]
MNDVTSDSSKLRRRLLAADVSRLPPEMHAWRTAIEIETARAAVLDEQLDWCTNRIVAVERASHHRAGLPCDFQNRLVQIGDGVLLCGIRHEGMDPRLPFVEMIAWDDALLETGPALAAAAECGMHAFARFDPRRVRMLRAGLDAPELARGWHAEIDQVLIAAPLGDVASEAAAVELAEASIDDALEFQADCYDAFGDRDPSLCADVRPSDRAEFEDCARDGAVLFWRLPGQPSPPAGLLAVQRIDWQGLDGWLVVEECVAGWAAGRGTAAAAQRALARRLVDRDAANAALPLFGTIAGRNTPSRRTAANAGRRELAAWWFVGREDDAARRTGG